MYKEDLALNNQQYNPTKYEDYSSFLKSSLWPQFASRGKCLTYEALESM